jgi:rsbT co-antagonist protein RsbR
VIIDITGIDVMDTKTADHFIKMAKAVRLLGAECILSGINPGIAQTLTHIGVDLTGIRTLRNLRDALQFHLRRSGQSARLAVES